MIRGISNPLSPPGNKTCTLHCRFSLSLKRFKRLLRRCRCGRHCGHSLSGAFKPRLKAARNVPCKNLAIQMRNRLSAANVLHGKYGGTSAPVTFVFICGWPISGIKPQRVNWIISSHHATGQLSSTLSSGGQECGDGVSAYQW